MNVEEKKRNTENDISKTKFKNLQKYLLDNNVFGFTATRRKHVIIYFFKRFFNGKKLYIKIKVDRKTKNVISVMNNGNTYTSLHDIKKIVE